MTRLPLAALVAVLALGVSACGDDDAGPTNEAPTSEVGAASVPADPSEPTASTGTTTTEPPAETLTEDPTASTPPEPTATGPTEPATSPAATPNPPPGGSAPRTYDAAQQRFDAAGQEPTDTMRFRTRSGIYCLLDSDFAVGCELPGGRGIPDPDYCGDGPTDAVGRVVFPPEGGPTPECNSDTIREPGARLLADGSVGRSPATGVQCLVEKAGVTCLDPATSRGFFLGKQQYTFFNGG